MYLVGFYSPKEKSGVTETSLAVYKWLKSNTSLSISFISHGKLEKERRSKQVIHEFGKLSIAEQKNMMKKLKKENDIVIYDASSQLSEEVLKLLPIVDRLFVLGEDNMQFAEKLHQIIQFNKMFDSKVKNFVSILEGEKTYLIKDNKDKRIGFTDSKKEAAEVGNIIYSDYVTYYLEKSYIDKTIKLVNKIKKFEASDFQLGLYELGVDFDKSLLIHKYLSLRIALGQSKEKAIEDLLPLLINKPYADVLKQFQNELYIAQISFDNKE